MSAKSRGRDTRPPSERPRRPTERAFVVQFEPVNGTRHRFRGRAELVASGEATRFRSRKHLLDFMAEILRR
jgi:hypothetical protein